VPIEEYRSPPEAICKSRAPPNEDRRGLPLSFEEDRRFLPSSEESAPPNAFCKAALTSVFTSREPRLANRSSSDRNGDLLLARLFLPADPLLRRFDESSESPPPNAFCKAARTSVFTSRGPRFFNRSSSERTFDGSALPLLTLPPKAFCNAFRTSVFASRDPRFDNLASKPLVSALNGAEFVTGVLNPKLAASAFRTPFFTS